MFKWRYLIALALVLGWTWDGPDQAEAARSCHGANQSIVCRGVSTQSALTEETAGEVYPDSSFFAGLFAVVRFYPIPEGTMLWCNVDFREAGEDYGYQTGQLLPNGSSRDRIECWFDLQFLNQEHEEGTIRLWLSTTYYGPPVQSKYGPADTGPVLYP